MSTAQINDPLRYEFDCDQEYQDYDAWFRAKVQEALDSKAPTIPHDQVMANTEAKIRSKMSGT